MGRSPMVKPKLLDILVFSLVLGAIGLTAVNVYATREGKSFVHIKNSSEEWILPLDREYIFSVDGPLGETVIEIDEGSVRVLSSPCPEKICIRSGSISRPGQWIACLPNRVFITIKGRDNKKIDAFSF